MTEQEATEAYRFGPFRFECATGRLYRDGDEVSLQPRASVLLEYLLENAGKVCTKQELMDLVWADVHVGEESLTQAVSLIRQALEDDARRPTYVETIQRRGYRFIGEVEREVEDPSTATEERPFGGYEIVERIGVGGMGRVYRARDLKLGRDVALKVLPGDLLDDDRALRRFEREAKLLASLNHPNIATLYALEESRHQQFLVMELVEGRTLAHRLAPGPLPAEEALEICRRVAAALEGAHAKGVVHRDLKPSNVMITPEGTVKLLDFGVAKALAVAGPGPEAPEEATRLTSTGLAVGTAPYMSPEQVQGETVDARADLWALGCLLYETLAGRRAFEGDTAASTAAAILGEEPRWEALPHEVPLRVRMLLDRCLKKDSRQRLHHAADARIEIEEALSEVSGGVVVEAPAAAGDGWPGSDTLPREHRKEPFWRKPAAVAVAALSLGFLLAWAGMRIMGAVPEDTDAIPWQLGFEVGVPVRGVAVSPDGRDIFYISRAEGDVRRLYHRPANRRTAEEVPGAETTRRMAFSPDGEWLALMTEDLEIKKLAVDDRRVLDIGDFDGVLDGAGPGPNEGFWAGLAWASDDTLVVGTGQAGVWILSASGGNPELLVSAPDERYGYPGSLPGGEKVVMSRDVVFPDQPTKTDLFVVDLESGDITPLGVQGLHPRYVESGHIVFGRDYGQSGAGARYAGTLFAVPFDAEALRVTGDPVPTPIHPAIGPGSAAVYFDVSASGVLVYVPEMPLASRSLVWVDQEGNEEPASEHRSAYRTPSLSSDGTRVAYRLQEEDGTYDIWIHDLRFDEPARLTSGGDFFNPEWSGDDRFVYSQYRASGGTFRNLLDVKESGLVRHRADFAGSSELITDYSNVLAEGLAEGVLLEDAAPTGDLVLAGVQGPDRLRDLYLIDPAGSRELRPLMSGDAFYGYAKFSPDGEWLAFTIGRPGQVALYVQEFPPEGEPERISPGVGRWPLWSPAGDEVYFWSGDGWIMAVPIRTEPALSVGEPRRLFEWAPYTRGGGTGHWDIAPDGRFLMLEEHQTLPPLARVHVVLNWLDDLQQIVPGAR